MPTLNVSDEYAAAFAQVDDAVDAVDQISKWLTSEEHREEYERRTAAVFDLIDSLAPGFTDPADFRAAGVAHAGARFDDARNRRISRRGLEGMSDDEIDALRDHVILLATRLQRPFDANELAGSVLAFRLTNQHGAIVAMIRDLVDLEDLEEVEPLPGTNLPRWQRHPGALGSTGS